MHGEFMRGTLCIHMDHGMMQDSTASHMADGVRGQQNSRS